MVITKNNEHYYKVNEHDNELIPSVTTILKILGSKEIIKWANYLGFKHIDYEEELERSSIKGTLIHQCMQQLVDESIEREDIKFPNENYLNICNKALSNFTNLNLSYRTIFTEKEFISKSLGYAGTIDWYAIMNGKYMLNDFKSSKIVYWKHLLQLGGYNRLLEENGYRIDGASIIIVNEYTCRIYPVNKDSLENLSITFDKLKEIYNIINKPIIRYDKKLLDDINGKNIENRE